MEEETASISSAKADPKKTHLCPYEECQAIERAFSCDHNLKQHIRERHTHERPHRCEECRKLGKDTAFPRPWSLTRHLQRVHGMQQSSRPTEIETQATTTASTPGSPNSTSALGPVENGVPSTALFDLDDFKNPPYIRETKLVNIRTKENFEPRLFACRECSEIFANAEGCLHHMHDVHNEPHSRWCNCTTCKLLRSTGFFDDICTLQQLEDVATQSQ